MNLFTTEDISLLIRLLLAHCLTDFILQPDEWVAHKKKRLWRSKYLWYHGLLTGIIAWMFLWRLDLWWAVIIITISHIIIDNLKLWLEKSGNIKREFFLFLADQLFHLLILLFVWLWIIDGWLKIEPISTIFPGLKSLIRMLGYILVIGPVGYLIQFLTRRWAAEINTTDSLKDAGRWIGILERVLILTFVYINQFAAIGFLIAAKSLLRVTDRPLSPGSEPTLTKPFSSRKHTEYVLIGTFLSFALAILIGLVINRILDLYG